MDDVWIITISNISNICDNLIVLLALKRVHAHLSYNIQWNSDQNHIFDHSTLLFVFLVALTHNAWVNIFSIARLVCALLNVLRHNPALIDLSELSTRVRPFFKVFEAQPCAVRSQWAEYEDIKFFEFEQRLPLPLSDFRKI